MDEEHFTTKSVKELRAILQRRKVDCSDCLEKSDLVARIRETMDKEPKGPRTEQRVPMGTFTCSTVYNSPKPDYIVILSHGLGANADDLLPIATSFIDRITAKIKFIFPEAPISLPQGGKAWWEIDLNKYMMCAMSGNFEGIINDKPPQFIESSNLLKEFIETVSKQYNVPLNKIIIGGFSQGAMMSLDVAFKLDSPVGAVFAWSPGYINGPEWRTSASTKKGLKIFHSHGTKDMIIPFLLAQLLKTQLLETNGFELDSIQFNGDHTIPAEAINKFKSFILALN